MNKKNIVWGIIGIVILVAVFYGGMVYGKSQASATALSQRQAFSAGGTRGTRNGASGGFAAGQIISKDATSITVQLMNGNSASGTASGSQSGSKIIFLDSATKISKSVDGTTNDLVIGTQISITGTPNTDGSLNAQSVQIRPANPAPLTK